MKGYENTVRYFRDSQNESRKLNDQPPITDIQILNLLLSIKHFSAAEWFAEQMYNDENVGA